MNWPAGWKRFADGTRDDSFVGEFRREAPANHPLANVATRTIGAAVHTESVLFELLDGSGRYAAVHLTFNQESDPRWPDTTIYRDWEHFEQEGSDF